MNNDWLKKIEILDFIQLYVINYEIEKVYPIAHDQFKVTNRISSWNIEWSLNAGAICWSNNDESWQECCWGVIVW